MYGFYSLVTDDNNMAF